MKAQSRLQPGSGQGCGVQGCGVQEQSPGGGGICKGELGRGGERGGGSHVAHTAGGSGLVSLLNARLWIRVLPLVTGAL